MIQPRVNRLLLLILSLVLAAGGAIVFRNQRHPLIQEQLLRQLGCFFTDSAVKDTENIKALAQEFAVGKPSAGFITRARQIGADEYSLELPSSVPLGKLPDKERAQKLWVVSRMMCEIHKRDYEASLDELEAKFATARDGSAQIQLTVVPPFLRDFCTIHFKSGIVTKVALSQLD